MLSIQAQIYAQRAGILVEEIDTSEHITEQEIHEVLRGLNLEELDEEASESTKKASNDTKGKLHELLVGKHLNGGNHMEKHVDIHGDSPKEAHDKLRDSIHPDEYAKIHAKAKSAADDIKSKVEKDGHKIHHVHWTSKPGDMHRSTGIHATQKQDASDVVVTTHKDNKPRHHGVSLKVTDSATKHVPISNLGLKSPGTEKIHTDHKTNLLKKYPILKHATNATSRKAILDSNPGMKSHVQEANKKLVHHLAANLHQHLTTMPKSDLVHHIKNVIHAHTTPMQSEGHTHIRHTTYISGGSKNPKIQHHSIDPSTHHDHILKDPANITVHHSTGGSLQFKHKGKTFASQSVKLSSGSDPLSSVKTTGGTSGD